MPSNDRDFIGLPVTTISADPSTQRQWTQEVRYAGDVSPLVGFRRRRIRFPPDDRLDRDQAGAGRGRGALPARAERAGGDARPARRLRLRPRTSSSTNVSAALFGQLEWSVTDRSAAASRPSVQLRPEGRGLRSAGLWRAADDRSCAHRAAALGPGAAGVSGRTSTTPTCRARSRRPIRSATRVNAFATYATSFKSVGLNLGGVPTDAAGPARC